MSHRDSIEHTGHSIINRLTSALSLITLGIFLLLNSTGVVPWSSWGTVFLVFLRIWPIFIIIAGFQVIFGKYSIVSSILSVVSTLVFVLLLAFAAVSNLSDANLKAELQKSFPVIVNFNVENPQQYSAKDLAITEELYNLEQVTQRELNFDFTSENFTIATDLSNKNYIDLHANYNSKATIPYLESDVSENTLTVNTGARPASTGQNIITFFDSSNYSYIIGQPQISTDLKVNITSGDGNLQLKDLNLNNLTINQTSGDINADLIGSNVKKVYLQMTSGDATLMLTNSANVKVTYSKTSGDISLNSKSVENTLGTESIGDTNSDYVIEVFVQVTSGDLKIETK